MKNQGHGTKILPSWGSIWALKLQMLSELCLSPKISWVSFAVFLQALKRLDEKFPLFSNGDLHWAPEAVRKINDFQTLKEGKHFLEEKDNVF